MSVLGSLLADLLKRGNSRAESPTTPVISPSAVPAIARAQGGLEAGEPTARPAPAMRDRRTVVLLSAHGQNDAITGLLGEYAVLLKNSGFKTLAFDLSARDFNAASIVEALERGDVAFALSYLGIGCDLRLHGADGTAEVNAWDHFEVPVLRLNGDIPAYFPARHTPTPAISANIYYAREFHHYAERWIGDGRTGVLNVHRTPFPICCIDRSAVDRGRRRSGKLVFLKNGNSPQELMDLWQKQLPSSVARLLVEICSDLRSPCLGSSPVFLDDLVEDALASRGYSRSLPSGLMHLLVAQIDDYFRRVKSLMIGEALRDFPVIIQGSHWGHLDLSGRRATLVPGTDFKQSLEVYASQLGVIDMSPNITSAPHDRVTRSAGMYALCLTNQQVWLREQFPGFERLSFEFSAESIQDRVADVLRSPDDYLDLAMSFGTRARQAWSGDRVVALFTEVSQLLATLHASRKPILQPYVVQ